MIKILAGIGCILVLFSADTFAQTDQLTNIFLNPSNSSKPGIWWFWGESITTKNGITKDLEALKQAGFGGVVLYEQVFAKDTAALKSLSPEWLSHMQFAASECARLGLQFEINSSNGYVAGGPWITPQLGMQRLVSSEVTVSGGRKMLLKLPQPPTKLNFYKDVAVLAFPTAFDKQANTPSLSSYPAITDLLNLINTTGSEKVKIKHDSLHPHVFVQLDYGKTVTMRSISYSLRASSKAYVIATQVPGNWDPDFYGENMQKIPAIGELECSNDGQKWEVIESLPGRGYQFEGWDKQTISFATTAARYFRLNLHDWGYNSRFKDSDLLIGNVTLQRSARIDQWEKKTGNTVDFSYPDKTPDYLANEVIDPSTIIDLTNDTDGEGNLNWDAPPGNWTIIRFGYTPTGAKTKHGQADAMGLECDRLSVDAATVQFTNYVGKVLKAVRSVPGAKLSGVNMDSGEHGAQNWTEQFPQEFLRRCGYAIRPYLPCMAGYVIESREQSDRFLFDVRRTIANLMSDNFYGTFQKLCQKEGMSFMAQAPGIATCMPSDNIQAKGRTDIPMGEFWMSQEDGTIDCKEAAAAAHVYGRKIVAAESFTGSMADVSPARMKPLADAALVQGVNRFVVLAYVHQPWDDKKPGVTEDRFYLPYQRHNTWWDYSTGFWNTLSRSSQMMQTGSPVIDILYHLGNDAPLKIATWRMRPIPPNGYDYDVCGDEALLQASVKNGRIVLPGGMNYSVLVLAGGNQMTLAATRHLQLLVKNGATIIGPDKPIGSPSLADGASGDREVKNIANALWEQKESKISQDTSLEKLLSGLQVMKDFEAISSKKAAAILYAHRRSGKDEIYFLANHSDEPITFTGVFRVHGLFPQAWDPEKGTIRAFANFDDDHVRTKVPMTLEANSSIFVVFREGHVAAEADSKLIRDLDAWKTLDGPWNVYFPPINSTKEEKSKIFNELISWTNDKDSFIKNYSGTVIYTREVMVDEIPEGGLVLDLGKVQVIASLKINGHDCGNLWKAPYAIDVSPFIHKGKNQLEIKVTNLWVNRLIADAGLPKEEKITWATFNPYKPGDQLLPSGLLGPVILRVKKNK